VTRALAALAVAVLLLAIGCREESSISANDLPRLVLQPRDLARGFTQFDAGKQVQADSTGRERADAGRFGRLGGWKARYRRRGTADTVGPLVVESRTDLFKGNGGAERDLDAYRADLNALAGPGGATAVRVPKIGEETFALTRAQGSGRFRIRLYTIVWRHANMSASVSATGFDGRFPLASAVALARAQEKRIRAAAAG
jgi:hypothetical protein